MRNRWYHPPTLHTPGHVEKKVSWLELFYDLIFVAAFIQLGNGLSERVSVGGFAAFAAVFVPLWIVWTGFTYYCNRFSIDDFAHRLLVILQMFAVGGIAVTAADVLAGETRLFSLSCAVALGVVALLYGRAWRQVPEARAYAGYWGRVFVLSALAFTVAAFVPIPWCYALWAAGVGVVLFAPLSKQSRALSEEFPNDEEHLAERYGLLTIIVLGESFVKVATTLSGGATEGYALLQASMTLLITCCVWWIYFDDVAGSRVKRQRLAPVLWLYAHLPMQIAVTATGVAIKKAVHFDLASTAPDAYRWLLSGTLALTMASVSLIDSVTERRQAELSDRNRVNVRFFSAVLLLLLAPAGNAMSAAMFLVLVSTVCVAQVVFDMMMAPLEAGPHHEHHPTTADLARAEARGAPVPPLSRRNIGEAIRKNTPSELRRDLYFYLVEGSWKRFFLVVVFLYMILNVFFAALYALQPGCIANADPRSFADAFYFSVQTMATIGYGVLSPETTYGNVVVVVEAAIGLLFVALATGFTFAKASRPRSAALFSRRMVIQQRFGKPALAFRVGNARGNEVVDATMTVTVLKDEITPEGEHMRRMHDLRLVRGRSPLFALSWLVIHEIDDDSPLRDVDWSDPRGIRAIIATLVGHDGTYGQTVYARHNYLAEDIDQNARFVDVISQLPDGRLMIDYEHFHDTLPADRPEQQG